MGSEMCIRDRCNTPAILVPYPYAADRHQDFNAAYAAQFGAALVIHQNSSGEKILKRAIEHSAEKYCSASIMLERDGVNIAHDYEILEAHSG